MFNLVLLVSCFFAVGAFILALASLWLVRTQRGGSLRVLHLLKRHEEERRRELHQRLRHLEARPEREQPEFLSNPLEASLCGLKGRLQILEMRVAEHDRLVCSLVTEDEARHLWNINSSNDSAYRRHAGLDDELRSLVRRGLLAKLGDFKIHQLPAGFEPREFFALTETGETLLRQRRHLQARDVQGPDSLPPPAIDVPATGEDDVDYEISGTISLGANVA